MLAIVVSLLVLSLAGVSNGAAVDFASKDISLELMVPRGQTRAQYLQSIIDYWTPVRMASAQPMEPIYVNNQDRLRLTKKQKEDGEEQILRPPDVLPDNGSKLPTTAGKVYFVMGGGNYLCSASVVNSNNSDTVVTAGHCVFEYERQIWASNWIFVPQYSLGSRPLGVYVGRTLATKQGWANSRDFNYDVGIVLVNPNDKGQHILEVTGGLGITLNPPRLAETNSFGYPVNMNSGETMSTCAGVSMSPTFFAGFTGLQLVCGMTGGTSGGPWIQQYDTHTRFGQQVSVNSFIFLNMPNNLFGPYFTEDNIGSLFREHQNQ